jgi:hypothetical protein
VKSHIKEIVDSVYEKDHVAVSIGKDNSGKEQIQVGANLQAVLKDLETQMREAATNPEFEKAARLRDEIKRLREMELDVLGQRPKLGASDWPAARSSTAGPHLTGIVRRGMLSLTSDADLAGCEALVKTARFRPDDARALALPTGMAVANIPLGGASLAQSIITWARAYDDPCLVPYVASPADDVAAINFGQTLHGFVATMMAARILSHERGENLRPLLYQVARARVEAMNLGKLRETEKGLSASLICVDHSTFAYLRPLYHAPNLEHPLRAEGEYIDLVSKLLDAVVPQVRRQSVERATVISLGGMLRELFANTHEHARTDFDGTPCRRSVRGIHVKWHSVSRKNPDASSGSMPSLRNFLEDHKAHWETTAANITFVELSVFDSGPGLAARVLGRHPTEISLKEEIAAVRACFLKHVSSKRHPNAGLGLYRTLSLLKQTNGYLRLRTGRLSLFKSFTPTAVGNFREALTSNDINLEVANVGKLSEFRPAAGTLLSVLLPVGRTT